MIVAAGRSRRSEYYSLVRAVVDREGDGLAEGRGGGRGRQISSSPLKRGWRGRGSRGGASDDVGGADGRINSE